MAEDSESKGDTGLSSRARRFRAWLMRPRTVRIVGPAALALGLAMVAIGLLVITPGGDGDRAGSATGGPGPAGVGSDGVFYPVPPELARARSYLVPESPPSAGFRLVIDSLGVNAQVVRLGLDPRRIPQVPGDGEKVAWYEFSATPGTGGNAVLAGHVRWGGDPGVFAQLDELEEGDVIRLLWGTGKESVYRVSTNRLARAADPRTVQLMAPTETDILTLFTCGGDWVTDSTNPLGGDFTERVVVQAQRVEPSVAISP